MVFTEEQRKESEAFYKEAIQLLKQSKVPFMLGGAFAMFSYTGIYRDTKDLDVFCKPSDYPRILKFLPKKVLKPTSTMSGGWPRSTKENIS